MAEEQESTTQEETTETATETKVENPEGVLKKNQELLAKLAQEKADREALAKRLSDFEKAEAERQTKALEKKGEWETLRGNLEESHKQALTAEQQKYQSLFENSSRYQLAVEIGKFELAPGASAERLAKLLLLDEIKPVEEDGKVVWRKKATDEEVQLNEFIKSLSDSYGEYFASDSRPGGDAPGNQGKVTTTLKRSAMSVAQRTEYIAKHGQDAYLKLPN